MIDEAGMAEHVDVQHVSVYDFVGGPYDAVYFSGSLMIMPGEQSARARRRRARRPAGAT